MQPQSSLSLMTAQDAQCNLLFVLLICPSQTLPAARLLSNLLNSTTFSASPSSTLSLPAGIHTSAAVSEQSAPDVAKAKAPT
jgi:hypothetical protein